MYIIPKLITLLIFALGIQAQTTFTASVTLTWTDPVNPSGTTYQVYRASGTCPSPLVWPAATFSIISGANGVSGLSYSDTTAALAQTNKRVHILWEA